MNRHSAIKLLWNRISVVELTASILSLLYTFLYLNQLKSSFVIGFAGSLLFVWLCWKSRIYADAVLQLFYAGLAVWGWFGTESQWIEKDLSAETHLYFMAFVLCGTLLPGYLLRKYTSAASPFLDCFITCVALSGTWLQVNFYHDNWIYFIFVNGLSILLYVRRGLFVACWMYVLYLFMSVDGYFDLGVFS